MKASTELDNLLMYQLINIVKRMMVDTYLLKMVGTITKLNLL